MKSNELDTKHTVSHGLKFSGAALATVTTANITPAVRSVGKIVARRYQHTERVHDEVVK